VAKEAGKVALTDLASSFNDVRRNRHRCADKLTPKRRVPGSANRTGIAVNVDRQRVRLPPHIELSIIAHV
jgi:hypothetical protein